EDRRKHDYQEAYLRLKHQSVLDFLTSVEHQGPCRDSVEAMHATIGKHYLDSVKDPRDWAKLDPYGRWYVVRHLILAQDADLLARAADCLTDLDYLQATLGTAAA